MTINTLKCKNCGSVLEKVDDDNYVCKSCGGKFVVSKDVNNITNISNITNVYTGVTQNDNNLSGYFRLIIDAMRNDNISSAKDYCARIINKFPNDKLINTLLDFLEELKYNNGKDVKLSSYPALLCFSDFILSNECVYKNKDIVNLLTDLLHIKHRYHSSAEFKTFHNFNEFMVCKHKLDNILADEKDNNELLELNNALEITYNDYKSRKKSVMVTTAIAVCLYIVITLALFIFLAV